MNFYKESVCKPPGYLHKLLLIMKITAILLITAFLQLTYAAKAQRISLSKKKATLEQLFKEIRSQTGFGFFYDINDIKKARKIDLKVENETLENVLEICFENQPFTYLIKENTVIVKEIITPVVEGLNQQSLQRIIVRGMVTDEKGGPLSGVNIKLKGTTAGTITDQNGNYSFNVPNGAAILVFSFIGYATKEIKIDGKSTINVTLTEENANLTEVIVVGYGTQKKVSLTGAVTSINFDEKLTNRAMPNVSSALSGLAPGLAVTQSRGMAGNNSASLIIRGLGTVNDSNPLIVVDGMPDVDINRINMNDVETVSVLKDAASAAVYGSRGANGVILITTKSGKGKKATVNFSSSLALENPTKAYQFMADYPRALTLHQRAASVNVLPAIQNFKNGTIDQWMALGMVDPLRYPNTDWWDIFMQDGALQNNNISASGSNDVSNFFISAGLMDEQGLQINNSYKRYNARINYDYKVRKNINVGVKLNGNSSKYVYALDEGFTGGNDANAAGNDIRFAIAGITPYDPVTKRYGGVMAYGEDPQAYNPYTFYVNNLNTQNRQEANGNFYMDWTPLKGLTARVDYSLNYYNQFRWYANIPNQAYNFQLNTFGTRVYVGTNAGVGNFTNTGNKTMLNGRLNYETTIAKHHDLKALFVYSEEYWYNRSQSSERTDRLHPSLHEVDAALAGTQTAGGNSNTEGLRSYIGRLNYAGYDKYLLEANFRYDGSSKFLPGSQYGFFPSVAIGWRFTQEDFINTFTKGFLNSGKVRLSYGSLGNNSGVGRYEQLEVLDDRHYMIDGNIAKGFVYNQMVNTDLTWETSTVFNAGMDLAFLDSRLTAEIDYYNRLTTGMNRPSDLSILLTGAYTAPRKNIGNLRNKGIELNLGWKDKIGNFNYALNMNASYNATRLEKWNEFLGKGSTFLNMPYHFLYAYEDRGIAQTWQDVYNATPQNAAPGDILRKDLNGDGRIDANDKRAYSNTQQDRPTTNFALNGNVSWKGIDLAFLLQGSAGRKDFWINDYNSVNLSSARFASTWEHWENPWSLENRDGLWPRLNGNANREDTTFWLDDLSFLRFKNVQLGYSLPKRWLEKVGVSSLRFFASAENLATITSYRGLDPEKAGDKNDMYPLNRSYSFGINMGL
jgi:TonB-linked SusC/RagA family outer membrane protein